MPSDDKPKLPFLAEIAARGSKAPSVTAAVAPAGAKKDPVEAAAKSKAKSKAKAKAKSQVTILKHKSTIIRESPAVTRNVPEEDSALKAPPSARKRSSKVPPLAERKQKAPAPHQPVVEAPAAPPSPPPQAEVLATPAPVTKSVTINQDANPRIDTPETVATSPENPHSGSSDKFATPGLPQTPAEPTASQNKGVKMHASGQFLLITDEAKIEQAFRKLSCRVVN